MASSKDSESIFLAPLGSSKAQAGPFESSVTDLGFNAQTAGGLHSSVSLVIV